MSLPAVGSWMLQAATNAQVCNMVVEHEGCCVQPLGDHADFVWDGQSQRRYRCTQKRRARLDHRLTIPTKHA